MIRLVKTNKSYKFGLKLSNKEGPASLGSTLKKFREDRKLTLKEVADQLQLDLSMLARIEKGQRSVNEELFHRLATFFNTDEDYLRTLALADKVYKDVQSYSFAGDALAVVQQRLSHKQT